MDQEKELFEVSQALPNHQKEPKETDPIKVAFTDFFKVVTQNEVSIPLTFFTLAAKYGYIEVLDALSQTEIRFDWKKAYQEAVTNNQTQVIEWLRSNLDRHFCSRDDLAYWGPDNKKYTIITANCTKRYGEVKNWDCHCLEFDTIVTSKAVKVLD